jgi:hypothetical protein
MVFSCWFATGVSGDDDRSRAQQLVFPWRYQTSVCCLRDSSPVHLYCLACTISSIGLMVTMMTTIMFCFLAKKKQYGECDVAVCAVCDYLPFSYSN